MKYFLAVDIGASSGRHMLAHMEEDRMVLEEVHRFYNGMTEKNGHKIWDAVAYRDARTTGMDEGMPDCRREAYCKESLPKGRENRAHLCYGHLKRIDNCKVLW